MFHNIARPYRLLSRYGFAFFALLLFPLGASADAGVPMLPFAYPVILVFLIPVIVIEVIYLRAKLKTRWRVTLSAVAKANAVTMLLGYPLAWVLFLGIELVLWLGLGTTGLSDRLHWAPEHAITKIVIVATSAAWMGPVEERWAIPFAFVILLLPSFILSGFVESRLLERDGWLPCNSRCSRAVWQANALSYVFLAIVGCAALWGFERDQLIAPLDSPQKVATFLSEVNTQLHTLRPNDRQRDREQLMEISAELYRLTIAHPESAGVWKTSASAIDVRSKHSADRSSTVCGENLKTMPDSGDPDSFESVAIVTYVDCTISLDGDSQIMKRNRRSSGKNPNTVMLELKNVNVSYRGGTLPEMTALSCVDCSFDLELQDVPPKSGQSLIRGLLTSDYDNLSIGISRDHSYGRE